MPNEVTHYSGTAKALEEAAKATNNAINLARDLGPFVDKVLGKPIEHFVGMTITDPLWAAHRLSLDWLQRRVEKILLDRDIRDRTATVAPALLVPLLDAAQNQTNDELKELWARLLANAMDPQRSDDLRIQFIETLKQLHPRDAVILQKMGELHGNVSPNARDYFKSSLKISEDTVLVSLERLVKENCLAHNIGDLINPHLTPYGRELLRACRP